MNNINPEIKRCIRGGFTVKQLKETLERFDDDTIVVFKYNSRDYWNTVVAQPVTDVDMEAVKYSAYHSKLQIVEDYDGDEEDELEVLVIR